MSSNQRATQKALATLDQSESDVSGFTGEAVNELVIKIIRCNNVKARNEGKKLFNEDFNYINDKLCVVVC